MTTACVIFKGSLKASDMDMGTNMLIMGCISHFIPHQVTVMVYLYADEVTQHLITVLLM